MDIESARKCAWDLSSDSAVFSEDEMTFSPMHIHEDSVNGELIEIVIANRALDVELDQLEGELTDENLKYMGWS